MCAQLARGAGALLGSAALLHAPHVRQYGMDYQPAGVYLGGTAREQQAVRCS